MNILDIPNNINLPNNINQTLPTPIYLFIALIVTQIPYIRVYFSPCNSLIREVIRVIFAGITVNKINLHNDTSRQLTNIENSWFKNTLITYAGYTGESLAAIGLFYLVSSQNYQFVLYLFIALIVVSVILWIRNFWGSIWALSFVVLLALPIYFRHDIAIMHSSILLSSFILIQSIINGIQVCRKSLLERRNPANSGVLSKVKVIPALMFGIVLLGQSLYTGYFILKNILSLH